MSRVGKLPVEIPSGVNVTAKDGVVNVAGSLGKLETKFGALVDIKIDAAQVLVAPANDTKESRAMWGTARAVIGNMVTGVSKGYTRKLELQGVGFRAALDPKGAILTLTVGFSHEIKYAVPAGVKITSEKPTLLTITGINKELVGQVAAEIRGFRKPEPYKGKGIRYEGERVRMKEGKKKK